MYLLSVNCLSLEKQSCFEVRVVILYEGKFDHKGGASYIAIVERSKMLELDAGDPDSMLMSWTR